MRPVASSSVTPSGPPCNIGTGGAEASEAQRRGHGVTDSERIAYEVAAPLAGRLGALQDLIPEAFTEDGVDFEKLRAALGDELDDSPERYSFTWAGKREAIQLLQTPSRATLAPARGESVAFDDTQHVFIEGENLETLKLLRKAYAGQVKMIYIDPPYNTGNDFIYPDDFRDPLGRYLQLTGQSDDAGNLLTSNPETSGRYHSAWLSMMYPRLFLARQLLREDGVIFVSIDDHEVHNLRLLMNEIFGEENFVASFIWQKRYSRDNRPTVGAVHDYILLYARSAEEFAVTRGLLKPDEEAVAVYRNPNNDPRGRWRGVPMTAQGYRPNQMYEIVTPTGVVHRPPEGRCWSRTEPEYQKLLAAGRIWFGADGDGQPNVIRYLSEVEGYVPWTWWPHTEVGHTDEAKKEAHVYFGKLLPFETPKPVRLLKRMLEMGAPEDDAIVLDFFAGSGTTAEAVYRRNVEACGQRQFVCVQLPEPTENADFPTLADMAKQRITASGAALKAEEAGKLPGASDQDLGVRVFKLRPSNFRQWAPVDPDDPDALIDQMGLFIDPLVDGWTSEDVLWEVAIKEGYALHSRVEQLDDVAQNTVWRVTDPDKQQSFLICLDHEVQEATVAALRLSADDLFICRDVALTDTLAANLALQCRLKTT